MSKPKRVDRVFVCHECHVAGASVDEDSCRTRCSTELDAFEENAYFIGKRPNEGQEPVLSRAHGEEFFVPKTNKQVANRSQRC